MSYLTIPTFIINLKHRVDRKRNILKEFSNKDEFNITIVEACQHHIGAIGLWNTIRHIIKNLVKETDEYILICEDDHQFTVKYSKELLQECILLAIKCEANILTGGVSWLDSAINVSENLLWINKFTGTQFIIIFKPFYKAIMDVQFDSNNTADSIMCSLSNKIMLIYPFISTQKDFGYSDVTRENDPRGMVKKLFNSAIKNLKALKKIEESYKKAQKRIEADNGLGKNYEDVSISTYVINLPERTDRLHHIRKQFDGRSEFDVTIIDAYKHHIGAYGLWMSIRKIIKIALEKDEDVIIICEDDHEFTEQYSKEYLIKNIIEAHAQGARYLSGGTSRFANAIPITENRFWVSTCMCTQFVVLYKSFFKQIIKEPFDENVVADLLYSKMTMHKMVLYPFISIQHDFGYSDVTDIHNTDKSLVTRFFSESSNNLSIIQKAFLRYHS